MCACAPALPQTGSPGPAQTTPMTHVSTNRAPRHTDPTNFEGFGDEPACSERSINNPFRSRHCTPSWPHLYGARAASARAHRIGSQVVAPMFSMSRPLQRHPFLLLMKPAADGGVAQNMLCPPPSG